MFTTSRKVDAEAHDAPEICPVNLTIIGTDVFDVGRAVTVIVVLTRVTPTVIFKRTEHFNDGDFLKKFANREQC